MVLKRRIYFLLITALALFPFESVFSGNIEKEEELAVIKDALAGIEIGAGLTAVFQGVNEANGDTFINGSEGVGDVSCSFDLELSREFAENALACVCLEAGCGGGVDDELKVFSGVNGDADDDENLRLSEAWYEYYFNHPITLTAGKIDPSAYIDSNAYANDETTQFLSGIFINSPAIEFAESAAGLRLAWSPRDLLEVELVFVDSDADWDDFLNNPFFASQINLRPSFFEREGNYRLIGWLNEAEHSHWHDPSKSKEKGYGFGLSFDQELNDYAGVFARYAWQDSEVYPEGEDFSLEASWSAGVELSGGLWQREGDVMAFACGQVIPSGDYKDVNDLEAKPETHLELYYSLKINEHLAISPDFQVIWQAYGDDPAAGSDTIVIGGLRAQLNF